MSDDNLTTRGADIVMYDPRPDFRPVIMPSQIQINGVDVGLTSADDPPTVSFGRDELLSVTITFYPRSLTFRQASGSEDG